MGYFIPSSRSQNLRSYSYSGHDGSLLSKYILTPYWNNLVKLFPMSVCHARTGSASLGAGAHTEDCKMGRLSPLPMPAA